MSAGWETVKVVSEMQGMIPKVEYKTHLAQSGHNASEERMEGKSSR